MAQAKLEDQRAEQAQKIENQRAEAERELAAQRAQDEALQAYLNQMSSLLLEKDLRASEGGSEVRTLARTLTVLGRLDGARKMSVVQFLYEAGLLTERQADVDLSRADLSRADLIYAYLREANLRGAALGRVNLSYADLSGARGWTEEQLSEALLDGHYHA